MNTRKKFHLILVNISTIIIVLVVIAAVFITGNKVLAQNPAPDGPETSPSAASTPSADSGDGLIEVNVPVTPLSEGGDGLPGGVTPKPSNVVPLGLEEADAILASFSYYRLIGTAFNNPTSATTYVYDVNGCVYQSGGTDTRFMAPLLIPDDSVIKFLRLYYDDAEASSITAYITRYQPGVTNNDLTSVSSSGSAGYGTTLSEEITHTVDLTNWAYAIIIRPSANSANLSFCGIRVAYYAPNAYAVAVPVILK